MKTIFLRVALPLGTPFVQKKTNYQKIRLLTANIID